MFWKKEKKDVKSERQLMVINELLKRSFSNVKRDTANIFQWLQYLYRKNIEQEQLIKGMQLELSYIPKTRDEIRKIVDDYYSFEGMMAKLRQLDAKVDELANAKDQQHQPAQPQQVVIHKETPQRMDNEIDIIERRLERLEQKKASVKERIIKRIARNSKEYVKSVILSYIRKYEKISALHLKDMVVDEQNFCSKSSFYRLLDEIEQLDDIGVIKHGKEKHYLSKTLKPI